MEWNATLKNLRISPRKTRLVADAIRGKSVREAISILDTIHKKSSLPIKKLLQSAVANAKKQDSVLESHLKVETIYVDAGMTLKRFRPRAFGRAYTIRKRSSQVRLTLTELEVVKKRKLAKDNDKSVEVKDTADTASKTVKPTKTRKSVTKKVVNKPLSDK